MSDVERLQAGLAGLAGLSDAELDALDPTPRNGPKKKDSPPAAPLDSVEQPALPAVKPKAKRKPGRPRKNSAYQRLGDAKAEVTPPIEVRYSDPALNKGLKKAGLEIEVRPVVVDRPPAVPWQPRVRSTDPLAVPVCPPGLVEVREGEVEYPWRRQHPDLFCGCCGRPVKFDGKTAKNWAGVGVPCPECGFKQRMRVSDESLAQRKKQFAEMIARGDHKKPETIAKARASRELKRKGRQTGDLQGMIEERVAAHAERVLKPYLEGLDLEVDDRWSPSTKLEFYLNQTQIADKLLDRVIGKPVQRNRHVTAEDEDVLRDEELSPEVVARMVAAIASGADPSQFSDDGVVVDAEVVDDEFDG